MTQFCAGFTVSEASTYLSDAGGGEVNFLRVTFASSHFVRFFWRAPGFGIGVKVFTVIFEVVNTNLNIDISYLLLVLKFLGL